MMVKYDLDIISESTRWQCHSFLSIAPWNINFPLKYLHVIAIFITSVLKKLGNYLRYLLRFQNLTMKYYFPKKRQKLLCKDEELASCEASVVFLGVQCRGAYGGLWRMLNSDLIISCTEIRTPHPEISQSSKPTFIYSSKSKIKN